MAATQRMSEATRAHGLHDIDLRQPLMPLIFADRYTRVDSPLSFAFSRLSAAIRGFSAFLLATGLPHTSQYQASIPSKVTEYTPSVLHCQYHRRLLPAAYHRIEAQQVYTTVMDETTSARLASPACIMLNALNSPALSSAAALMPTFVRAARRRPTPAAPTDHPPVILCRFAHRPPPASTLRHARRRRLMRERRHAARRFSASALFQR